MSKIMQISNIKITLIVCHLAAHTRAFSLSNNLVAVFYGSPAAEQEVWWDYFAHIINVESNKTA